MMDNARNKENNKKRREDLKKQNLEERVRTAGEVN